MSLNIDLGALEGEQLYNGFINNISHMSDDEINFYFLKLDGRFLYEAGKNSNRISNDVKRKGFMKLEGKYIVEAMKHWKGITKEDKKNILPKLMSDGRLYAQAVKILGH